jgi:uncharacterized protein YgbK (DUF1537 family)
VLRPSAPAALRAIHGRRAAYVVTNTRILRPAAAAAATRQAADAVLAEAPSAHLVLRGDSTLRAHFSEEHDAVRLAQGWRHVPAVLVPALPAAGRVTRQGVHYLLVDGDAVPVSETEFAHDPHLGYGSSHLLEWAESRSGGRLRAVDGTVVPLDAVRGTHGADAVASAIQTARSAVAIDAETDGDIQAIARGIELAWANRVQFVLRCSPALGAALAGATAQSTAHLPPASRILILCGSFVERTTRQLARLLDEHPGVLLEIDGTAADADAGSEGRRLAHEARKLLDERSIAVVATPRLGRAGHGGRLAGARFTETLATVARELRADVDRLVLKGGATSAAVVADGLGADVAEGVGPVGHGAALWLVGGLPTIVAPGNVGDDDALLQLVGPAQRVGAC